MNKIKTKLKTYCASFAVALLFFAVPCGYIQAASQTPPNSKTPIKSLEKHKDDSDKNQRDADITNKISSAMPNQPQSSPYKGSRNNHISYYWWSPEWCLVYITGFLVLATCGLMIYTAKLWRSTKVLSEEAKETSARQASEMIKSLDLTKESLDLARKEFISTHRPKLIIRGVTMKPHTHPSLPIETGKPIIVEAVVVNIGNSSAEIFDSNATLLVGGPTFGARTPFGPPHDNINGVKFVPGGAYTFTLTADKIHFENAGQYSAVTRGEQVIYFFGYIMYRDALGNERRTAFCRRYDPNAERFTIVNAPDYEYTD